MMGAQRDRQSNRAFKLASDSVRLWFFFPTTPSVFQREEQSTAVVISAFIAPLLHPSSPQWASILAILESWWIPVVGKMAERSESARVSCHACFYFFLIVGGSSWGLIDLKMSWAGGLFCPILLFSPAFQSYWCKGHIINSRLFFQPTFQHTIHSKSLSSYYRSREQKKLAAKSQKKTNIKYTYTFSSVDSVNWMSFPCVSCHLWRFQSFTAGLMISSAH